MIPQGLNYSSMIDFNNSIKKFTRLWIDNHYRHWVSYLKIAGILSDMQHDTIRAVSENIVPTTRRKPFKLSGWRFLDIRGMEWHDFHYYTNPNILITY